MRNDVIQVFNITSTKPYQHRTITTFSSSITHPTRSQQHSKGVTLDHIIAIYCAHRPGPSRPRTHTIPFSSAIPGYCHLEPRFFFFSEISPSWGKQQLSWQKLGKITQQIAHYIFPVKHTKDQHEDNLASSDWISALLHHHYLHSFVPQHMPASIVPEYNKTYLLLCT